jgi:hypothetical protein
MLRFNHTWRDYVKLINVAAVQGISSQLQKLDKPAMQCQLTAGGLRTIQTTQQQSGQNSNTDPPHT